MSKRTVPLSNIPATGEEFEDYIAALFQASGHFVEKGIIESDPADVLELDIFATDYSTGDSIRRLVEVKGGKWGYTDLFKVLGWMRYLGIQRGAFFVTKWDDREGSRDRMSALGLDVVCFDDFASAARCFEDEGFGSIAEPRLIALWRHSYGVERKFIKTIATRAKGGHEGAKAAKTYHRLINNGTFFSRNPEESLEMLYDAYMQHPKLTLGYAQEIDGRQFDPHSPSSRSRSYRSALLHGKHPELQACMYIEHRARLAILKAAIDYVLANLDTWQNTKGEEGGPALIVRGYPYDYLPNSLQSGIDWLQRQPNFRQYATFWQQFLWSWGGFYLQDREDEEFERMSKYSGIPVREIPTALETFDRLFPMQENWLVTPGATDICVVKMVPMIFQGVGGHHRRIHYFPGGDISALKSRADYTRNDLVRRINCAVEFLLSSDA